MYQRLTLIGRLGRDPEMRYTPDGTPVTSFSVAIDRRWTDANGQQQQKTTWFRVTAWRKLAETCNQFLSKGQLVLVEGELSEPRTYQSRNGSWRASLDVRAITVKFLSSRAEAGAPGVAGEEGVEPPPVDEEEIPF